MKIFYAIVVDSNENITDVDTVLKTVKLLGVWQSFQDMEQALDELPDELETLETGEREL